MNTVENLKKITLSFQAGSSPEVMDLTPKYPQFEFIFALGQEGMSPFEYELVNKTEGEEVLILPFDWVDFSRYRLNSG